MHRIIATGLSIGYIGKGGGTVAAAACCIAWYLAFSGGVDPLVAVLVTVIITDLGVWAADGVESLWGEDSPRVVIDEIAGMCISLLFLPVTLATVLVGFVLFRFFDIVKPLYIRRAESIPGGWGVMADDLLAGLYANVILQVAVRIFPL
jgi:phosphatidylglycerophosphatase A